jgi:hypothetical protein
MRVTLDNPFELQAPQFIIPVMNGYTDTLEKIQHAAPTEDMSKDMQSYIAASGVLVKSALPCRPKGARSLSLAAQSRADGEYRQACLCRCRQGPRSLYGHIGKRGTTRRNSG